MKLLFASVPQWFPVSPYLACALLAGQVEAAGFSADTYDFNIEFFNDILTKERLQRSLEKAARFLEDPVLPCEGPASSPFQKKLSKVAAVRKEIISAFFLRDKSIAEETVRDVENAVSVFHTREKFYDPEQLFRARDTLESALDIISLPYAPSRIRLDNYIADPVFTYDFEDVDYQCRNADVNMFLPYFEEKLSTLDLTAYSMIGLSITDLSQIVPGFTLARLLKQKTNAKICLGGNYIYKIVSDLKKIPSVFYDYCDFLQVGDGETAVVELAEFIAGRISIENVHSLIYMNDAGEVIENEKAPLLHLDRVSYPDFDTYRFEKYFSPEVVIPVQLGKGCYWGKCTFCDFYTGQQKFDMKSVSRAVDEVEYLSKKYNTPFFNFVDEAVPPSFYNAFATEILRRGLKIYFYSFARLEKAFTPEVLKNLYNAGARFFMWGYEADSERVMHLMNKGVDLKRRKQILRDSAAAGLWNLCTFLLCYPSETPEELQSTIDVIYDEEIVNTATPSNFAFKKNAILKDHTQDASITDYQANGQLHISYKYHSSVTTMQEIKKKRNAFEKQFLKDTAQRLWPHTFTDCDMILMYLARFGRDYVKNYRLKYRKRLPGG